MPFCWLNRRPYEIKPVRSSAPCQEAANVEVAAAAAVVLFPLSPTPRMS